MVDKKIMKEVIDRWDEFARDVIKDSRCTDPMHAILTVANDLHGVGDDFEEGIAGGLMLAYMIVRHCEDKVN